jgi:DNA topoisomerase-1
MDIVRINKIVTKGTKHEYTFTYKYINNTGDHDIVTDTQELLYIKDLHIPPAWTNVNITLNPKEKIQAYGYDLKQRKQVIYAKWFTQQNKTSKYDKIMRLEPIIQQIKSRIHTTLASYNSRTPITNELQIILILHIMMLCNFRIGNDVDTRGKHKAYGLTTLLWSHVKFCKNALYFEFVGKKGVINKSSCSDPYVFNILRRMKKLRGDTKDTPTIFSVSSTQVNQYLHTYDPDITSKDIRTWMANELYMKFFFENAENETKFEKRQRNALAQVATHLHNTPAVCKTSYIFPEFLDI